MTRHALTLVCAINRFISICFLLGFLLFSKPGLLFTKYDHLGCPTLTIIRKCRTSPLHAAATQYVVSFIVFHHYLLVLVPVGKKIYKCYNFMEFYSTKGRFPEITHKPG